MPPSEESMKIAGVFERYTRDGNKGPIEEIPEEKLRLAYLQYARDKGTPHYRAMEMRLEELKEERMGRIERVKKEYSCGPLGNPTCNQRDFIDKEYSDKNIFLDIPYTNYEQKEIVLREVMKVAKLNAVVAKDILTSNAVLCKVCKIIQTCKYGLADISFNRHSVTYELGLMHGFGKKVCILLQEDVEKFSDILGLEHASYIGVFELRIKLATWLIHNIPEADKNTLEAYVDVQNIELQKNGEIRFPKGESKESLLSEIEEIREFKDARISKISANEMPVTFEGKSKAVLHLIPSVSIGNREKLNIDEITKNPGVLLTSPQ